MSTKSLVIAALTILGSSSLALADTYREQSSEQFRGDRDHDRDGRPVPVVNGNDPCATPAPVKVVYPSPVIDPIFRPIPKPPIYQRPLTIGTESRIWKGTETFYVGAWKGQFQTLKLENTGVKSFVGSVRIKFADGRSQNVTLNEYVSPRNPCLTIDLAGRDARAIQSVTVTGANARNSTLSIVAV